MVTSCLFSGRWVGGFRWRRRNGRALVGLRWVARTYDLDQKALRACVYTPQVGLSDESEGHNNQIDYMLVRRGDLRVCKDYKVFLGMTRILRNLNEDAIETFRVLVSESKVAMKQTRFKELFMCREDQQDERDMAKERYKLAKSEAKKAVAQAKDKAYEDLYKRLDSKVGENDIYKIVKPQERRRRDVGNIEYIKDEGGDENPIRTLRDYSKPRHEGYRNTIELLVGNNMGVGKNKRGTVVGQGFGGKV
nr:TraB domain-containing protein [Tanacetum cinerariifolium]